VPTKRILVVDDEPNNLRVLQEILKAGYKVAFAKNGKEALAAVPKHEPDLILLDIMMPGMDGYEVCRRLKTDKKTESIPVIFITAMGEIGDETKGFEVGAVDYIMKPVNPQVVLARVNAHLSLVKTKKLDKLVKDSIIMIGMAGHYNDTDTGKHIWRMGEYSRSLAQAIGLAEDRVEMVLMAAPMHDTGKIGIPDNILKAPRKLTPEEWKIMESHTTVGCEILSKSDNHVFKLAAEVAKNHHEKWDGSGYPEGVSGDSIPESARIVAVADVFDALTTKRPYKEPWTDEKALGEIKKAAGTHFDKRLVEAFVDIYPEIKDIKKKFSDDN
jgi:putative two-component system response regulator